MPFTFLNTTFEKLDRITAKTHILYLILAAIASKILVALVTTVVFHSFVDLFDIGYYLEQGLLFTQGQIPYINFEFAYPILLLIPITIALIPTVISQNAMAFVLTFQSLMVLCDIVTILCVYLIRLKLWDREDHVILRPHIRRCLSRRIFRHHQV